MTLYELQQKFPNDSVVIDHFIKIRYNGIMACHTCGSIKVWRRHDNEKFLQCGDCNNTISVFKDTIFEDTKTSLVKWMYAINLFLNGKKGISGLQLKREIGVTYKTAWRMLRQIRIAMGNEDMKDFFDKTIEVDEVYIGGKPRKNNGGKQGRAGKKPGETDKTPVVGIIDRENKKAFVRVSLPDSEGARLTSKQLLKIIEQVAKNDTHIITDEAKNYDILQRRGYLHSRIDHSKEFARGDINTNSIESFWATLKRGILGIYHHVSIKYLQSYVNEFCFRYNNLRNKSAFDTLLSQSLII